MHNLLLKTYNFLHHILNFFYNFNIAHMPCGGSFHWELQGVISAKNLPMC